MKKVQLLLAICFGLACKAPVVDYTPEEIFAGGAWVDLTHSFSDETIYWPNNPSGFVLDTQYKGTTDGGYYYESFAICAPEHGGTHLDAPIHFAEGKWSAEQVPLESLIGNAVVIDVSAKTQEDPDYQIMTTDVLNWEQEHATLPGNTILLLRTGWSKFYPDRKKYLGTDKMGDEGIAELSFPGIHPELAEWLVKDRKIKAVGIDVASIDHGRSTDFKTHQVFYKENIPGFENLTNLDLLPEKGAFVVALPMKIKAGSGGPLRIVAWVPGK